MAKNSYQVYIDAITGPIKAAEVKFSDKSVTTSRVNPKRLAEINAELAKEVYFDKTDFIFRLNQNFYAEFHFSGVKYVALCLHNPAIGLLLGLSLIANSEKLIRKTNDDALFLNFALKFKLELSPQVKAHGLANYLQAQVVDNRYEVDFDLARDCYGNIYFWEVSSATYNFAHVAQFIFENEKIDLLNLRSTRSLPSADAVYKDFDLAEILHLAFSPLFQIVRRTDPLRNAAAIIGYPTRTLTEIYNFQIDRQNIVFLSNGGAGFEFLIAGQRYVAIASDTLSTNDVFELEKTLSVYDITAVPVTEGMSTIFAWSLQPFYRPKREFRTEERLFVQSYLDTNNDYLVHLETLSEAYENFLVLKIGNNCALDFWSILAKLAITFPEYRSPFVNEKIISIAENMVSEGHVSPENIYLSLTASQWKYAFLEIYRVLEAMYYFATMKQLRDSLKLTENEYKLLEIFKKHSAWSEKEKQSIQKLFQLVPRNIFLGCDPCEVSSISMKLKKIANDNDFLVALGGIIYSIRNSAVHQSANDVENSDFQSYDVTADCWPKLTEILYRVIDFFYENYQPGLPPR